MWKLDRDFDDKKIKEVCTGIFSNVSLFFSFHREKADLVDLCSALQETLRRFRDREVESQKQLQKALEIVERGNAAQLDAEERAKQLEADVNVLEEKANENEAECNRMRTATEESKSTEINELRREMGDMERELAEARLKTERLDRQKVIWRVFANR